MSDFGWAIKQIKEGKKVARNGWNGKGMFIFLVHPIDFEYNGNFCPHIDMTEETLDSVGFMTADSKVLIGWLASQSDMLSEDWELVGE
jgi:hypothetical protein